jgi:hypothetical protein
LDASAAALKRTFMDTDRIPFNLVETANGHSGAPPDVRKILDLSVWTFERLFALAAGRLHFSGSTFAITGN